MSNEMARICMRSIWIVAGLVLLAGCSSPEFVDPPPASLLVPLPKKVEGVWAPEVENGERVRLAGNRDGSLDLFFVKVDASDKHEDVPPLKVQTMHFDNADWIVLTDSEHAKPEYVLLLKFELETSLRLCGYELDSRLFAEAIESGQLQGKVRRSGPLQQLSVTVTSSSADWMKWWSGLPESRKTFGPQWCFRRAG